MKQHIVFTDGRGYSTWRMHVVESIGVCFLFSDVVTANVVLRNTMRLMGGRHAKD